MFIYEGIMLYVQILIVILYFTSYRYYVHKYETRMFKKTHETFQHELFISKTYPQNTNDYTIYNACYYILMSPISY